MPGVSIVGSHFGVPGLRGVFQGLGGTALILGPGEAERFYDTVVRGAAAAIGINVPPLLAEEEAAIAAAGADFTAEVRGDTTPVKTTLQTGGDVFTALQNLQSSVDAIPTSGGGSASDVWAYDNTADQPGLVNASQVLLMAGAMAWWMNLQGVRSGFEPWFVLSRVGATPDYCGAFRVVLGAGNPADQGSGESDLTFMGRVLPGVTWHANYFGTGRVGGRYTVGGMDFDVWYAPLPGAAAITEPAFVEGMLAVKPDAWADLVEGGLSMSDALSAPWKVGLSGAVQAVRFTGAAHFLVVQHKVEDGAGVIAPSGRQSLLHPMNINPGAQLPTETDVEFLNRIGAGGLTWDWKSGANSIAYASDTDVGEGIVEEYYYSPLDRFPNAQRMLTYTPNSGPPDRSLWEDAVAMMSRMPISFD